jgi:hypothetical protein
MGFSGNKLVDFEKSTGKKGLLTICAPACIKLGKAVLDAG